MEDRLKTVLAAVLGLAVADIGEDASPETLPSWDSVMQMNILLAVEDEFGVRFDDDAISELASYALIRDELAQAGVAPA